MTTETTIGPGAQAILKAWGPFRYCRARMVVCENGCCGFNRLDVAVHVFGYILSVAIQWDISS